MCICLLFVVCCLFVCCFFGAEFKAALVLHGQKPTNNVYQQCMAAMENHKITYTVAQWIRHRPTEPGIAGSSPAGVT